MPEITSVGKYCPNCNLMTFLTQDKCERCGHQFRTGETAAAWYEGVSDVDPLNKTQMFMRSPISTSAIFSLSDHQERKSENLSENHTRTVTASQPKSVWTARWRRVITLGLVIMTVVLAGVFLWSFQLKPPQYPSAVYGAWASYAPSGQINLKLDANGRGVFSWCNGRTPLIWQQDKTGHLNLDIKPSLSAGTVPGALIEVLNSRGWDWHVDTASHVLRIGPLPFKRTYDNP